MLRLLALISILGGLAWWLYGEQSKGRFQQVDRGFLDLMLANARDRFVPDPTKMDRVVYLPLREEDKAEYAAWPPQPVDYQMIIKGAASFEPSLIVITDALNWQDADQAMVTQMAESLLPIPHVLTTRSNGAASDNNSSSIAIERVPAVPNVSGPLAQLPEAKLVSSPAVALARQADLAMASEQADQRLELLSRQIATARPAPSLLALLRLHKVPLSEVRAVLGGGSALYLGAGHYLPLTDDGQLQQSSPAYDLPQHNALDLMTAGMLEDATGELAKQLGKGKVLVIGTESATDHTARQQAATLALALSMPAVTVLDPIGQMIAWGVAGLLGLSLIWLPKDRALKRALLYLLFALVGSFLAFQMTSTWFPPAIPALLLLSAGVFLRLFGKKAPASTPLHG